LCFSATIEIFQVCRIKTPLLTTSPKKSEFEKRYYDLLTLSGSDA